MPLVEPLREPPTEEIAALAAGQLEALGFVPNSFLTMQRSPAITMAFVGLLGAVMREGAEVGVGLKRLVGLAASYAAGCRYCQAHLAEGARRDGVDADRIENLWNWERSALFTPAEKAAFAFAQAAASVPNGVDDAISAELKRHWSDDAIVELLAVVSLFGFLNRWNDSMGTTLEAAPAALAGDVLGESGWDPGKHRD